MSGVKHTPGPWRIDVNGSENWTVDYEGPSSTFMTICANGRREPVGFAVEPTAWGSDDEIEANARLFAAAPCMFEAGAELQAARKAHKLAPSAENLSRVRIASDAFDAAIARARGEQDGGGE